jgi:metal-responsive CopG/Arc/MetJ family transcriptional regulator
VRATIEIPDRLRPALLAIAARKGYRGYSRVITEALEFYLQEKEAAESGLDRALALKGSWDRAEADEARQRLGEVRRNWKDRPG